MLPSDALFWHAEEAMPEVRPYVAGLLMLDRSPERARFRAAVQWLTTCVPRLRQRVTVARSPIGLPEWEDDPHFNLDHHLREIALPQPGTRRRLLDFAGRALVAPLDRLRPLWEAYAIGGLEGGGAACLFKLHHSIVDGVGSMAFFETLTQADRTEQIPVPRRPPHSRGTLQTRLPSMADTVRSAAAEFGTAMEGIARVALHPLGAARGLSRTVGTLSRMMREFNAHAINDPLADGCSGIGRRLDTVPFSLARMQGIKDALGVSLNDLVLTAVAGAVGRYHQRCGAPLEELECVVPMNLRQAHERELPGNRIGLLVVPLPVGEPDPLRRLKKINSQTTAAKASGGGSASQFLLQALPFIPGVVFRVASEALRGKIGLICTNVPGPRTPRYLAGAKVDAIYPFVPPMFGIPLTVALLSYGDTFTVGIDTDDAAITRPHLLSRYFGDAVDDIERHALPRRAEGKRWRPSPSANGAA
jgi:WS/DGAT/MGAT family acyltransferase